MIYLLPPRRCGVYADMAADVHILDLLASSRINKIKDVKIFKVSSDIVFVVDSMGRVTASGSPVGGVTFNGVHTLEGKSVHIPVWCVFMNWRVQFEDNGSELRPTTVLIAPRHNKCPSITWFTFHITVDWKMSTVVVVDLVITAIGNTSL